MELTLHTKSEDTPTILLPVATNFRSFSEAMAFIGEDEDTERNRSGWLISMKRKKEQKLQNETQLYMLHIHCTVTDFKVDVYHIQVHL